MIQNNAIPEGAAEILSQYVDIVVNRKEREMVGLYNAISCEKECLYGYL